MYSQATIAQIKGEDTSGRAKHIDMQYKFCKDLEKKAAAGTVLRVQGNTCGHPNQYPPSAQTQQAPRKCDAHRISTPTRKVLFKERDLW